MPRRFVEMKRRGERIVAVTAYDVLFAGVVEEAAIDIVLVGDSLGQVVLGFDSTLPVTMDDMVRHGAAVRRGAPESFVVIDLPFMSYQASLESALSNAGRALSETGAQAVKIEGGGERVCEVVRACAEIGIPVMGHVGLTPQSVRALGGYRVQGREPGEEARLVREADALQEAGAFAVVLELVPRELAGELTERLDVPTIGIGAGPDCDGQVLVLPDLLGLNPAFEPRFLERFADVRSVALAGLRDYATAVRDGSFPAERHAFSRSEGA